MRSGFEAFAAQLIVGVGVLFHHLAGDEHRAVRPGGKSQCIRRAGVEVELDAEGSVTKATATSGHAMLRQSAEDAAKRSKFKPALFNGKPIKAKGVITYNFSL